MEKVGEVKLNMISAETSTLDRPEYVFVATNFHNTESRQYTQRFSKKTHSKTFPTNVTLGFRGNFWHVFSSITEYDKDDFEIVWLGKRWLFMSFWISESDRVDFSAYLEDKLNVFITFVLKPLDSEEYLPIKTLIFDKGINEQQAVDQLFECFREKKFFNFLKQFVHKRGLNALFVWSCLKANTTIPNIIALFTFYSFGLLMTWKISRDLTDINVSIDQKNFQTHLNRVLQIRSQIINVERHFLTHNISNDDGIVAVWRDMRGRMDLATKQSRFLPLIDSMERQLLTASQIKADINSSVLNGLVFVIGLFGLSISLMSMLLALSPTASILVNGTKVLLTKSTILFFLSASLIPFMIFLLLIIGVPMINKSRK